MWSQKTNVYLFFLSLTLHRTDSVGRMGLDMRELKLEVYGHVTLECHSPDSTLANGSGRKLHTPGELGRVHHRVGMDGHQQVLVSLQMAVWVHTCTCM